jgi:aromatic ring-opening dioxygenase catalytic subunit (LigB family)
MPAIEAADQNMIDATSWASEMPCLTFNHGSGVGNGVSNFLAEYVKTLPEQPKGVLIVEAHAEADPIEMVGDSFLGARAAELLKSNGIPAHVFQNDRTMGHGAADAKRALRQNDLPFVTMSLRAGQNAAEHLAIGMALAPLRQEGILLLGSGVPTFHNFDVLFTKSAAKLADGIKHSYSFDSWLLETLGCESTERFARLCKWDTAPGARVCHPVSEAEHFMPTVVIAGAAQGSLGRPIGESSHGEIIGRKPRFACRHFDFR